MFEPAIVMTGIGIGAAGVLAVAARVFHVDVDPRIAEVEDALPGANCGGCGFSGCGACAVAMVAGKANVDACIAGGADTTSNVAAILGGAAGSAEPRVAVHGCEGGDRADRKYKYDGALDCRAMYELFGGDITCQNGCLGAWTCVRECPFDALERSEEGVPEVLADKCVGCGRCEEVCPTDIIKVFKLSDRLLHFNAAGECHAPCGQLCPAQIDIPRYVDLASKGLYAEAIDVVKERNPLPLICGRVCPAPCEVGCRRAAIALVLPDTGKRVGIVGGGPCGLSAAYYLRRLGHHPVIFDSKPGLGGMLRYGIPEYRLPKKVLDFEIQEILDLGVETRVELEFGREFFIEDMEQEFDAVLIALGAWDNSSLRVDGEELEGVWKGTEFLEKRELGIDVDLAGKRIVVVGGGNTAMDACRSSLRMGAAEVTLLYRRTRKEMPANAVEIVAAEEEGVKYHFLAAPTRLIPGDDGAVAQIEFLRMELGEPDDSGRRRPVPVEGSESVLDVDVVIAAIGQKPLPNWYTDDLKERGLQVTKWNTIKADEQTLQSDVPHIFTGGDLWTGPALLVDAVGSGRRAARSIHQFLNGEKPWMPPGTFKGPEPLEESRAVDIDGVERLPATRHPELPAESRIHTFEEVDLVVTEELMRAEANRCMRCGTLCFFKDVERDEHHDGKKLKKRIDEILRISPDN